MITTRRTLLALLAGLTAAPYAVGAEESPAAPAGPQEAVAAFRDGLAAISALGLDLPARSEQVAVLGDTVLAIGRIATAAVGSARMAAWPAVDQAAVVTAFRRYTAVVIAERLPGLAFAAMRIGETRDGPNGGMVVDAQLEDDAMQFLVVSADDGWRILDVMRAGISELAVRRSEFAAAADEGPAVLVARLEARTDALLGAAAG